MALVSVTRLRVRLWRYLPAFLVQSFRVVHQAKRAEGNLAASVLRDANLAFWTRTLWRDEAVMRSFMGAGAHQRVMPRLPKWCDEAALVHWEQDGSEPPSWLERIGACGSKADAPGSITLSRRSAASTSQRRERVVSIEP